MQKQNERHEQSMLEIRKMLKLANEENAKRAKEIELLGKSLVSLRTTNSLASADFSNNFVTDDDTASATTMRTAPQQETTNDTDEDDEEEREQRTNAHDDPRHPAKLSIQFIPTLRGRDDIGVEGFIKKVKKARAKCRQQTELLDLILNQRITEDAERSIRHLDIDNYTDLYTALRQFVSIPTTADNARDRMRQVRQGNAENVHSYTIRYRKSLNELIYALQFEHKDAVERRVAIDLENRRAVKTYVLNLRDEVEARVSASSPKNLAEAQEAAFQAETTINEKRRLRSSQTRTIPVTPRPMERRPPPVNKPPTTFQQQERRPFTDRTTVKCFKCNQVGHLSNQCVNFRVPSQHNLPPQTRVNHTAFDDPPRQEETSPYVSIQQPDNYPPYGSDHQQENPNDFSSIQDPGLI